MSKSGQHNQVKSVFGRKLTEIRNTQNFESFAKFFGVSQATLSRYVSGAASPSMQQLWDFILRYAASNDMQLIDLNWFMNDNDRRPGPVFINQANASPSTQPFSSKPPAPNASRWSEEIPFAHPKSLHVVGEAAADESQGSRAGVFGDNDRTVWDAIEIPPSTHIVKVKGDSMAPVILADQYVMVGDEYPLGYITEDREIVVAEVTVCDEEQAGSDAPWEGVYVKRVVDGGKLWYFQSINLTGGTFSIAKENCRLWPVIGVWFAGHGKPPEED